MPPNLLEVTFVREAAGLNLPGMGNNLHNRPWMVMGALVVAMGIAGGAVGAHVLEAAGDPVAVERMETASAFAVPMGLALILLAALRVERVFLIGQTLGILLFCVLLGLKALIPEMIDASGLGGLIPIGGSLLIVNWLGLAVRWVWRPPDLV